VSESESQRVRESASQDLSRRHADSLSLSLCECALYLALLLARLQVAAAVPGVLALGERYLHLGVASLEVHAGGDECEPLLLRLADQPFDLALVHEQLARPLRLMVLTRGGRIR